MDKIKNTTLAITQVPELGIRLIKDVPSTPIEICGLTFQLAGLFGRWCVFEGTSGLALTPPKGLDTKQEAIQAAESRCSKWRVFEDENGDGPERSAFWESLKVRSESIPEGVQITLNNGNFINFSDLPN